MSSIEIEDPVLLDTFETDSRGRINFGEERAHQKVRVCVVEFIDDEDS